jgi:hypothetical protein
MRGLLPLVYGFIVTAVFLVMGVMLWMCFNY